MQDDSNQPVDYVYIIGDDDSSGGSSIWVWNKQSAGDGAPSAAPALSEWMVLDGAAVHIAVSPLGSPWVVNSGQFIYRRLK